MIAPQPSVEARRARWRDADRRRRDERRAAGITRVRSAEERTSWTANERARLYGVPGRLVAQDVRDLWERQPVCVVCGQGRGLDHIVDMSRGGANDQTNLQNLCRDCNSRKFWSARKKVA